MSLVNIDTAKRATRLVLLFDGEPTFDRHAQELPPKATPLQIPNKTSYKIANSIRPKKIAREHLVLYT